MGNTPAVQNVSAIDEKEKTKKVQLAYEDLLKFSDLDYTSEPSFKIKSATSTIQKTPELDIKKQNLNNIKLPDLNSTNFTNLYELDTSTVNASTEATTALGYEIVKALERNEEVIRGISDILINNIKGKNKLLVELTKEEQAKLNELLTQLRKNENADTVKTILNILTASSAIVMGGALLGPEILAVAGASAVTSSALWGLLLVASGVTNLVTNEVLPRINGFEKIASFFTSNEDKKQDLADNIQTASSITSTILSITSAIATSPILGSVLKWAESGKKIFDVGLGLVSGGANLVKDIGEHQLKNVEADQTLIKYRLEQEKNDLESEHLKMQNALDVQKTFNNISASIIHTLSQVSQKDSKSPKTANTNIQMEIAATAAESIRALNTNLANRFIHIFHSRLESQEATFKTAKSQNRQALPHGFSAVVSFTCAIATGILKSKGFANAAQVSEAMATAVPKGADFFAYLQNKNITIESDRSKSSEFDKQMKTNTKDTISSSIGRTVEISSRLIQTAGAA